MRRISFVSKIPKPAEAPSRLKRWSHWMPYASTFLLLGVFGTREVLHERWKSTADALRMAQYMHDIQNNINVIGDDVKNVHDGVIKNPELSQKSQQQNIPHPNQLNMNATFASLAIIVEQFPKDDINRWQYDRFREAYRQLIFAVDQSIPVPMAIDGEFRPIDGEPDLFVKQIEDLCKSSRSQEAIDLVGSSLTALETAVTVESRGIVKQDEFWANLSTWISGACYCLAVVLSLIAKLYGTGGTVEAE